VITPRTSGALFIGSASNTPIPNYRHAQRRRVSTFFFTDSPGFASRETAILGYPHVLPPLWGRGFGGGPFRYPPAGRGKPPPRSPPPMVISPRSSPRGEPGGEPGGEPAPGQFPPAYPSGKSSPALFLARLPTGYRHDCPRPREGAGEERAARAGRGSGGEHSVGDGMKARRGLLFWNRCTTASCHLILEFFGTCWDEHYVLPRASA